jgi:DNA-binding NarL/FixJ family response regulator
LRILIIDDHALIREALRGVLKELKDDATIVEAANWRQASQQIEQGKGFDLVLLDLNLPDRDGSDILAELRERYPAVSVMVLSARHDRESVARALELGALSGDAVRAARLSRGSRPHRATGRRPACP